MNPSKSRSSISLQELGQKNEEQTWIPAPLQVTDSSFLRLMLSLHLRLTLLVLTVMRGVKGNPNGYPALRPHGPILKRFASHSRVHAVRLPNSYIIRAESPQGQDD